MGLGGVGGPRIEDGYRRVKRNTIAPARVVCLSKSMTDVKIQMAYYGDDFTGSTDVLEALAINGIPNVLFLEHPEPGDLEAFEAPMAIGIAGTSRGMSPSEMDDELPPAYAALAQFDPDLIQYKVCSTFDSAPEVGSIGHAIDLGQDMFESPYVPVVVAVPQLAPRGRYVVFGNLFATVDETTYRIDRHPTMRDHPVTPMREADLTRHLGAQTDRSIGNLEIRHLDGETPPGGVLEDLQDEFGIVLFDGLTTEQQQTVGRLIWESRPTDGRLFAAASSGLNYALAAHWQETGLAREPSPPEPLPSVDRAVVMSGSASPVTRAQIDWAIDNGFTGIRLDAPALIDPSTNDDARAAAIDDGLEALERGESVVWYSARGPDDPAIQATRDRAAEIGIEGGSIGRQLGEQQGRILREILDETGIRRVCVAGGDTSGHTAPALEIYALEFLVPAGPGSPICRGHARTSLFDGIEIALKGGQVETEHDVADYFGVVRDGGVRPQS